MDLTKEQELDYWKKHKAGDKSATNALLRFVMPHVNSRVSYYRDVPIPTPALHGEAMKMAIHSFDTWDPKRGARLATNTVTSLQRMSRFVTQNKNIARIPEHRAAKIGTFLHVRNALDSELGRPPSPEELADELSWSVKEVRDIGSSMRKDLSESGMPEAALGAVQDRQKETMHFVRYGLTPDERKVFDHHFGFGGAKQMSVNDIAKRVNKSPDWVYRVRRKVIADIQRYS